MQKVNKILFSLSIVLSSFLAWGSDTDNADENIEKMHYSSIDQDLLVDFMQNNITFENEKRALSNQLELEKIKNELAKIKADTRSSGYSSEPENNYNNDINEPINLPSNNLISKKPKIILYSQVAGLEKFGVSIDGKVSFVSTNKVFKDNTENKYMIKKEANRFVIIGLTR